MTSHRNRNATFVKAGVVLVQLALASLAANATAADADEIFTLSGFGTAALTHSSFKTGDFVADSYQAHGAGASGRNSASVDSKFALQLDAKLSDKLSAVVQTVMRSQTDNTFTPMIEWANLKYAVTNDLSVRVGRTALPVYMLSQTRHVGYANPWVRPPVETYSQYTLSNADGIDVSYRFKLGGVSNTTQLWHGKTTIDVIGGADGSRARDLKGTITGIANTMEIGYLTAKIGYNATDFKITPVPGYNLKFNSTLINAGAIYDPGSWFVQGEVTRTKLDTVRRAGLCVYVTAGMRIDQWTPYATISRVQPDDDQVKLELNKQTTVSAGARWDFRKNMDLKLQLDRISLAKGSNGQFINVKPGLAGSSGTLLTAAIDYVF